MGARDEMYSVLLRVDTTSGSGNATTPTGLYGVLMGLYLDFHASASSGTDTTIQMITPQGVTVTLLTLTDVNTDGYYPVVREGVGATGSGIGQYFPYVFTGCQLKATVSGEGGTHTDALRVVAFFM